jgi:2,5-diamino-6-(ribosylamino)-4(3H)-pyrimidinone 5'-phosphate reductase
MITSVDGKVAVGGKAGSIGSSTDRTVMRTLRSHADAVMIGAGTLRAERLTLAIPENLAQARRSHSLRPQPLAIVVTVTGDVPLQKNLLGSSPDNLLVLASPETTEERLAALAALASIEIVPQEKLASGSSLDLTKALEVLKKRYAVDVLLVEGGPSLNYALASSGLVDELFLTLAPKLLGGVHPDAITILEGMSLLPTKSPNPELISVHLSNNELFLRYFLRSS